MIGLTSLEVYNSTFNKTADNTKFELYTHIFDEFSFTEWKAQLQEILHNSNISPEQLQDNIIGPRIIRA